jgi:hypothetical protein
MVLTAQLVQLPAVSTDRTAVAALTGIALRLANPVHDRLRRRPELASEVLQRAA